MKFSASSSARLLSSTLPSLMKTSARNERCGNTVLVASNGLSHILQVCGKLHVANQSSPLPVVETPNSQTVSLPPEQPVSISKNLTWNLQLAAALCLSCLLAC